VVGPSAAMRPPSRRRGPGPLRRARADRLHLARRAFRALIVTLWPARRFAGRSRCGRGRLPSPALEVPGGGVVRLVVPPAVLRRPAQGDVAALRATGYGHALLVKAGLVLVVLTLGALERELPRSGSAARPPSPRRSAPRRRSPGSRPGTTANPDESARAPPARGRAVGVTTAGARSPTSVGNPCRRTARLNAFTVHATHPPPGALGKTAFPCRLDQAGRGARARSPARGRPGVHRACSQARTSRGWRRWAVIVVSATAGRWPLPVVALRPARAASCGAGTAAGISHRASWP
jgi:hypothetical protein